MVQEEPNFTHRGLRLLRVFMEDVRREHAGADLMDLASIASGNLYPLLLKFEREGLLESRWEDGDPKVMGRPRRRFYRLTPHGAEIAHRALSQLSLPSSMLIPGWSPR